MPNSLKLLGKQLVEIWRHFGAGQRFSAVLALLLTLAAMGGMLYWSSRPDYRLLFAGLSMKDAAAIREKLQDDKIPVQIKDSGRAIYVPAAEVNRCRLMVVGAGLLRESGVGFELFEQPKFGLTDFAQQVNYQRAMQGELERTIASMQGIESARVMLVLPKEKLFAARDEQKATASILLTVAGGVSLSAAQVQSIVQMVGSAVPGLSPTSITVTDQSGRLLTRRVESPEESFEQANEQLIAQEKTESMLAKKAQEMLDMAMGPGRSIVRVNVALDFSKTDKRSEKYDSENRVVRSETIESENTSSPGAGGGGVAGAVANVPVGNPGVASTDAGGMSKSKKENVRTEYAIPSDVEQVSMRGAKILHLSVSVCVAKSEKPVDKKSIEQLVKNAVGFQEAAPRKDSMEVAEMEFPAKDVPASVPWWKRMPISLDAVGRGLLGLVVLVVIWRVSKRVLEGGEVRGEEAGVPLGSLAGGNRNEMLESIGPGMADRNLGEISSIARQNPKSVAAWISNASNDNMPS